MKYKSIIFLGDIHTPYADMKLLQEASVFAKKVKADYICTVGDLLDQKAWSRFPKEPDDDGNELEWQKSKAQCKEIAKLFPKMTIIPGNHDRRYMKKAKEAGLVNDMITPLSKILQIKGWNWHQGPSPLVLNDNIAVLHGDELSGAVSVKCTRLGMNVVAGHSHKAEIQYVNTFNKQLWGMDVGMTADKDARCFDYAASSLTKQWSGFAWIDNGVPHLFPKKGK